MLELESFSGDVRGELLTLIRNDMRVQLLYVLPRHKDFIFEKSWMAAKTGLEVREVNVLTSRLLQVGLWTMSPTGRVALTANFLNLSGKGGDTAMTVPEYLTLASQVLSELSAQGPCWYEFSMIPTNQELKKEFLAKVMSALQDLVKKSAGVPNDTVIAWTNVSLEVLGPAKKGSEQ